MFRTQLVDVLRKLENFWLALVTLKAERREKVSYSESPSKVLWMETATAV